LAKPKGNRKAPRRKNFPLKKQKETPPASTIPAAAAVSLPSWETFLLLLIGFLLIALVFLQFDAFRWLGLPFPLPVDHLNSLLFLAAALLFLGFRGLPSRPTPLDSPRWLAYPVLLGLLALTAYMRLYRGDQPMGRYWDDPAICIIDPCNIFELHVFRMTFAIGHREPLYPYAAAGLWWLFPAMKGLLVQRVTSTLFDLGAVWLFYRLGREITGKRTTGLILAALGAVSKPMIMQNLGGMPGLTLPFIISLILWFQFRLFRKPDLSHFLQWGFVLGFGFYSYIAYRPWMLFLAFATFIWIFWKEKVRSIKWPVGIFLALALSGLFLFLLDRLFFVFPNNHISRFWSENYLVWSVVQALLFTAMGYFYRTTQGKERVLVSWGLGVLLAGFLVYPLAMDPEITIKIHDERIGFWDMVGQFSKCVRTLFVTGDDRSDMNVEGDPFFDYHAAVFAMVGLVFAISRFSWTRLFLLLSCLVGVAGRLMTVDPTSAKILGAFAPMLLLSAWGLEEWISGFLSGKGVRRSAGILLLLGLTAFWVWEGKGTFTRVYDKWWNMMRPDILVSQEISNQLPTKRVYMGVYDGMGYASPAVEGVIHDGEPLYFLQPTNVIDVLANEPRKDFAVIISGQDKQWAPILRKDFPDAQWIPKWEYYQAKSDPPTMYDVVIPAAEIPEKPGKLFMFRVVPEKKWLRRVYVTYYGLGRGMIQYEDTSPTLNPLPQGMGAHSVSADGEWAAPVDGKYTLTVNSPDPVQVWIDGKKALESISGGWFQPHAVSRTLFLSQGPHQVRYLSFLRTNAWFEDVTIRNSGANFSQVLGQ
jgi:hypothetical protein